MKKAIITGANRSIGFETARQLLQKGYYVFLGSRVLDKGQQAVEDLKKEGLRNVEAVEINTDDPESIKNAGARLEKAIDTIDVLINNAGISGGMPQTPIETDISVFRQVFDTNFFGVVEMTQRFINLLKRSPEPRIVNVTSGLGSLTMQSDPAWAYHEVKPTAYVASKAALNAYTIVLADMFRDTPFKINAVDPGYTATEFNNYSGPGSIPDAASRVVKAATLGPDGPTGFFFSDFNSPDTGISPW